MKDNQLNWFRAAKLVIQHIQIVFHQITKLQTTNGANVCMGNLKYSQITFGMQDVGHGIKLLFSKRSNQIK